MIKTRKWRSNAKGNIENGINYKRRENEGNKKE